jgi:hypothetical protein
MVHLPIEQVGGICNSPAGLALASNLLQEEVASVAASGRKRPVFVDQSKTGDSVQPAAALNL